MGVGNDSTYNHSECFYKFPFPDATPDQQTRIRALAEQLDAHRKRQQAAHPTLTLTDLYNVVEKLRQGPGQKPSGGGPSGGETQKPSGGETRGIAALLTAKEQTINQQGLASVVVSLHQQLDAAVSEAYGWPGSLPESDILTRLVALNHARVAEEAAGQIRYLRPAYQAPETVQTSLVETQYFASQARQQYAGEQTPGALLTWPKELAGQMQVLREVVMQSGGSVSGAQVAGRFAKVRPAIVQPLLDTLVALALLRQTDNGGYAG